MVDEPGEMPEKHSGNSPECIPETNVFAYNLGEGERPGGMKVRWRVRVETGQRAEHWDRKQAEAIREFLTWAQDYKQHRRDG
jgi:hypothetical protein